MENILQDNLTGTNQGKLYPNLPLRYLTASSVTGDKVTNDKGEQLGEIVEIMLDLSTGTIDYFVIEFGGFLGIGVKYFAIPFRLLKVNPDKKIFVFNQPKEELEKAPGFDMEHWPDTNIHFDEAYSYWSFMG
jgi:sporulation protein YlmC with PRC-barrel domain